MSIALGRMKMKRREFLGTVGAAAAASVLATRSADSQDKKRLIGYSVSTLANPFFQGMTKGVVTAIRATPDMSLLNTNANGDANAQATAILDMVNRGAEALIINAINSNAIVPVVMQARKHGIPVFTLDRGAACGDCQINFLETDNVALGREGAQFIAQKLKDRYGSVKGNVVDLVGLLGSTAGDAREKGFSDEFNKIAAENSGLKLIARQEGQFNQERSFNLMSQIMAAHPVIDAVFNGNDDNVVGALRAVEQGGRDAPIGDPKHIIMIGIDGTEQALTAIRRGKLDATLSQNPLTMAAQSVTYISDYFNGKKGDIPAHQYWPHFLVTKETIDTPAAKAYGLWADELQRS